MAKLSIIQALRAAAVLFVVLLHLHSFELRFLPEMKLLGPWVLAGNSGVDLFFIISGFVMMYTTGPSSRPGAFLMRRFLRIYPLYWLVTAGFLIAALVKPSSLDWQRLGATSYPKALLLVPQEGETPLSVAWTLVHEVYFYLVFSVFLFFGRRRVPQLLALWAGLLITAHITFGAELLGRSPFIRVATHPLTLEFIAGALVCWCLFSRGKRELPLPAAVVVCAAALGLLLNAGDTPGDWERVLWRGAPWLPVVAVAGTFEQHARSARRLLYIGDASYSIYLLHCPVISMVYRTLAKFQGSISPLLLSGAALALGGAAAIAAGCLCYRCIEQPLLARSKKLSALLFSPGQQCGALVSEKAAG